MSVHRCRGDRQYVPGSISDRSNILSWLSLEKSSVIPQENRFTRTKRICYFPKAGESRGH